MNPSIDEINPVTQQQPEEMNTQMTAPQPPNLPCGDLLRSRDEGRTEDYIDICVPLYNASIIGDWEAAEVILRERPKLVGFGISENYDTALHIAASAKSTKLVEKFVENLVNKMSEEELELQNKNYNTALCLAAAAGNVEIVETMVKKNPALPNIPGSEKMMPLFIASLFGQSEMVNRQGEMVNRQREMVNYLYGNSNKMNGKGWTHQNRGWVLEKCVEADLFDVAMKIVIDHPKLAKNKGVLGVLARKTEAFRGIKPPFIWRVIGQIFAVINVKVGPAEKPSDAMQLLKIIWADIMKLPSKQIADIIKGPPEKQEAVQLLGTISGNIANPKHPSQVLFVAAEMGNTEFVVELIRQYPDLIWKTNDNNQTIFHVAVSHRQAGIYNLLYEIGSMKDMITIVKDEKGNNMLHLAGKQHQEVSGVALQMQRELLWFKEVKSMIPPSYRERKNNDGLAPHELFAKEHKDLRSAGEKWMKNTASQCMVVAALIATIVFAAAFTIPGGYNQNNGIPMFLHKRSFIVFVISDAISLTFSSISILIFLSILTSRYAEDDFMESLPKRLMRGLATLFLSIMAMMVAFSVSFFVLFQNRLIWVPIVISVFASIPVILYARLQYDLLADVYHSTYGTRNLFKPKKLKLYYQNPRF